MNHIEGQLLAGEFDDELNVFAIHRFKEFYIQSMLNESQLMSLYHYLKKHEHDEDGQIVTLYDQLPVKVSQEEIRTLIEDIEKIKEFCSL